MDTSVILAGAALLVAALAGKRDTTQDRRGPPVSTKLRVVVSGALAMAPPVAGFAAGQLLGLKQVQAVSGAGGYKLHGPLDLVHGIHINPLTWWGLLATARGTARVVLTHPSGTDAVDAFASTLLYQQLVNAGEYKVDVPVLGGLVKLGTVVEIGVEH